MKKIITLITLFAISIMVAQASNNNTIKDNIQGIWTDNNNIQFSFKGDSLFIDEIGNEGFCYTYKETTGDTLHITGIFDNFDMVIVSLEKTSFTYYFNEYPYKKYTLYRKDNN